jgi:hypothetical protein
VADIVALELRGKTGRPDSPDAHAW